MTSIGKIAHWDLARRLLVSALALVVLGSLLVPPLTANEGENEIETYAFEKVWWRTDLPVQTNRADRTWVWGPEPISSLLLEPYDEGFASGLDGVRWVQYFDKTRVEIIRTDRDRDGDWYVSNGLLAKELITGRMQLGDANAVQYEPADLNVAGDPDDETAPTYRSLNQVLDSPPLEPGSTVTQTLNRDGSTGDNPEHAGDGVEALAPISQTDRSIASVFWNFMNADGVIYDGFDYVDGRLFEDPLFATGLPITEPYWTTVRVGGEPQNVLVQAFERRVLTYTPGNPEGWRVEAANVGRHYYQWRYQGRGGEALRTDGVTTTRDLSDNLVFLGEVENTARAAFSEVEVEATIRDEAGEPIHQFRTYLDASLIEPGERLPFQIWTEYQGESHDYEISVQSRPSHRLSRPNVTVETTGADWVSTHRYEIGGTVHNNGDEPVEYLQFVVALYNDEGDVVAYRWGMIEPIVLEPDAETNFGTIFFDPGRFSDYKVFVSD